MPHLAENHYGKSRVRVVKVTRHEQHHDIHEWSLGVYLTGDFEACYTEGDNTGIMATDTMKNTVYSVARNSAATTPEDFALELARFIAGRNPGAATVRITAEEKLWMHLKVAGPGGAVAKHPSAFMQRGPEVATTSVTLTAESGEAIVTSGIRGLVVLKTSHSAFTGFHRDELTTLPETMDRLLGTEATITWLYRTPPADYAATRAQIFSLLLTTFAQHDSLSVQQTLYAMAEAVLAAIAEVAELTLTMPNRHNIPVNLSHFAAPFNQDNPNTLFVPMDEPSGHIQARVVR